MKFKRKFFPLFIMLVLIGSGIAITSIIAEEQKAKANTEMTEVVKADGEDEAGDDEWVGEVEDEEFMTHLRNSVETFELIAEMHEAVKDRPQVPVIIAVMDIHEIMAEYDRESEFPEYIIKLMGSSKNQSMRNIGNKAAAEIYRDLNEPEKAIECLERVIKETMMMMEENSVAAAKESAGKKEE